MPTSRGFSVLYFQPLAKIPLVHGLVLVVFNQSRLVDLKHIGFTAFQLWVEQAFRPAVQSWLGAGFSR